MARVRSFVDEAGNPLDLVLYKTDYCGYCWRVRKRLDALGYEVPMRDTIRDPEAQAELVRVGGKSQVPCLFINGKPLYESNDINAYFEQHVRPA